ncbi:MAG: hypothetical protein J5635_03655 [Paludibacteraceae bacterium]|nr:hypothetical protein [Paludibacteraceae bacterium]
MTKPPTWDYRPIYYDPKKDEMDRKLAALQARRAAEEAKAQAEAGAAPGKDEEAQGAPAAQSAGSSKPYIPTLHRGSFREAHDAGMSAYRAREARKSKLTLWIVFLVMILFGIYLLGLF